MGVCHVVPGFWGSQDQWVVWMRTPGSQSTRLGRCQATRSQQQQAHLDVPPFCSARTSLSSAQKKSANAWCSLAFESVEFQFCMFLIHYEAERIWDNMITEKKYISQHLHHFSQHESKLSAFHNLFCHILCRVNVTRCSHFIRTQHCGVLFDVRGICSFLRDTGVVLSSMNYLLGDCLWHF